MTAQSLSPTRRGRQALHRGLDVQSHRISPFWTSQMALSTLAIVATSFALGSFFSQSILGPPSSIDRSSPLTILGLSRHRTVADGFWGRALSRLSPSEHEEHHSMLEQEPLPPIQTPILVFGLPRSGSTAIHQWFQCFTKLHSSHYCCDTNFAKPDATSSLAGSSVSATRFPCPKDQTTCGDCVLRNMQSEREPFEGCGAYDVWSQFDVETSKPFAWFLPQHFALPLLQEAHPNATIILNYRGDPGAWADGVLHWHSVTQRMFHSFHLPMSTKGDHLGADRDRSKEKVPYGELLDEMEINLQGVLDESEHDHKRQQLIKTYQRHHEKVRTWIRSNPQHRLIELNVDDPKAGDLLAQHFESHRKTTQQGSAKTPSSCWHFDAYTLDNDWKDFSFPFSEWNDATTELKEE